MKVSVKKNLEMLSLIAAIGGLTAASRAQTVFSENFESQPLGAYGSVYDYGSGSANPAANIVSGVGVSGSQGLEIDGVATGNDNFGVNSITYTPSGNTSANLSDYTLSFDMAVTAGSPSDNYNLDFLVYGGGGGQDFSTWGNLPAPGAGFTHYSANMGTLGTMYTGVPLDPTASSWSFSLGKYGGADTGSFGVIIDNIQVTMVPEPSTIALCGLGLAAGIGLIRRRRA